jgi:hypothetical protein
VSQKIFSAQFLQKIKEKGKKKFIQCLCIYKKKVKMMMSLKRKAIEIMM